MVTPVTASVLGTPMLYMHLLGIESCELVVAVVTLRVPPPIPHATVHLLARLFAAWVPAFRALRTHPSCSVQDQMVTVPPTNLQTPVLGYHNKLPLGEGTW